jgi:hypothetical protein
MAAEGQPVNQSGYHCGVLKQIRPLGEWQICGHNGAALFASVGDDLKQQFRLVPVEAEIAQLIQDQQICLGQRPFQLAQMVVILGFTQFRRKRCRILKQDIVSLGAGFQTQSNRQMGLAPDSAACRWRLYSVSSTSIIMTFCLFWINWQLANSCRNSGETASLS